MRAQPASLSRVLLKAGLSFKKMLLASAAGSKRGAWFLFLPSYSPDFNVIEIMLPGKAHLRRIGARAIEAL